MEAWDLYLITRLDGVRSVLVGLSVAATAVMVATAIIATFSSSYERKEEWYKRGISFLIPSAIVSMLFWTILVLTPTSKEVMVFIAVDVITHEEKVITTADKLYEVLDQYLDNKLKEEKKGK